MKFLPSTAARGFTLIEMIMSIVILGILAAVALPRFSNVNASARAASINALAGSVRSAMGLVNGLVAVRGIGAADPNPALSWITLDGGVRVRMWNGYPDRWCDGIAITQLGTTAPAGGCYLSSAAVRMGDYTFYGYGNSAIPNGDAGWRIDTAPTPQNCSVRYTYGGSGRPVVTANTSGC